LHDAAGYQWGIDGDPEKDSGDIRNQNGNSVVVFDYRDNWKPSGAIPITADRADAPEKRPGRRRRDRTLGLAIDIL